MRIHRNLRAAQLERDLSRLGALVSLIADDVATSKAATSAAEKRLIRLQSEIERLYLLLNEPFEAQTGHSAPEKK